MNLACVIPILLLAASASTAPNTDHRGDTVNGLRVVKALITTSEDGVNHAYWFQRLFDTQLSPEELTCARNATVYFAGSQRCEWLFEQGPCAARQWLVLDKQGSGQGGLRPVCRRRPCAPGYGFLADTPRCAPQDQLCAESGRVFRYSLRGEGRCHCKGVRTQGPDGKCHVLFIKGPCPRGQMLAPGYGPSLDSFRGACVRNPCPDDGHVRVESERGSVYSECSAIGTQNCTLMPAPLLSKETGAYMALCDVNNDPTRNAITIHSRPSRDACAIKDEKGNCVGAVVRTPQPFDWGLDDEDDGGFGRADADKR